VRRRRSSPSTSAASPSVFQLGEIIDEITEPGLYFKVPLLQNVKYFDKRILTLDNPEPDRITTSEKKPLLVDFVVQWRITDVRQYYMSVQGDEEARGAGCRRRCARTSPRSSTSAPCTTRSRRARQDHGPRRAEGRPRRASIGVEIVDVRLRRVELPPDVTGPVYARMESERRRVANELRSQGAAESEKIRADADRQREVILADAYKQAQKVKGDGDAKAAAIYAAGVRLEPGVLRVLPQPRGLQGVVPQQGRRHGARSELGVSPGLSSGAASARYGGQCRGAGPLCLTMAG
jgi:membrane protease subunit HflC